MAFNSQVSLPNAILLWPLPVRGWGGGGGGGGGGRVKLIGALCHICNEIHTKMECFLDLAVCNLSFDDKRNSYAVNTGSIMRPLSV